MRRKHENQGISSDEVQDLRLKGFTAVVNMGRNSNTPESVKVIAASQDSEYCWAIARDAWDKGKHTVKIFSPLRKV
jgi:hypothetical protein